jgi:general secretion pathway protein F
MPLYLYEAADSAGRKQKARAEAADEKALAASLRQKGLIPVKISPFEARKGLSLNRVTKKDLLAFTSELGSLLEAGLPVDRAVFILSENAQKDEMRSILREICVNIQKGQALSQAMARHKVFPKVYVNMIKAGEAGGILEQVIKRLADFLETTASFRDEMLSALIYPALLVVVGGAAVSVLILYVIPKFAVIFKDMGESLPGPTLLLLGISEFIISYWWAGLLGAALLVALMVSYARTAEGRLFLDSVKLKIPVVRTLHLKFAVARFSRTLGTLMQSGVPVLQAVRISREVLGNEMMSLRLKALEEGIQKGRGVAPPLKETGVFPATVGEMIGVGEEAGRLEETFLMVAGRFEQESRSTLKRAISLLEPALILMMGIIVGFVVVSMLLAVFGINDIPI